MKKERKNFENEQLKENKGLISRSRRKKDLMSLDRDELTLIEGSENQGPKELKEPL